MTTPYVIRGGLAGRERLRVLARVMQPTTSALLDRLGLSDGMRCLDVGCGGGDVAREIAMRVAPHGSCIGADLDQTKIDLARDEARASGIGNVEFQCVNACDASTLPAFDFVYARFLLTHLKDPASTLHGLVKRLTAGAIIAIEDIDCSAQFVHPPSAAFDRYRELYREVVRRRGGDPDIGPRLPLMFSDAGVRDISVSVVQPMGLTGEAKLMNPITMENIADAAIAEGLTTREEADRLVADLHAFAADPRTLAGVPRVFQVWGRAAE